MNNNCKAVVWKVIIGENIVVHIMTEGSSFYDMKAIEEGLYFASSELGLDKNLEISSIEKLYVVYGSNIVASQVQN